MQECEALCTKLVICKQGQIQCIGTAQSIKSKYCNGLNLTLKCTSNADLLENFILKNISNSRLIDRQQDTLFIQVNDIESKFEYDYTHKQSVADIFFILDSIKDRFGVESFSITEPTLEQVFFAVTGQANQLL